MRKKRRKCAADFCYKQAYAKEDWRNSDQALDTKDELVVASFRFFRPVPGGSGSEEHYYTIELGGGKITSIRNWFPNALDATANNYPHMEEVTITFTTMRIVYETGGVEYAIETEGTK